MTKHALLMACAVGALGFGASGAKAAPRPPPVRRRPPPSPTSWSPLKSATPPSRPSPPRSRPTRPKERDLLGIDTINDLTNFTPGLRYSTGLDRIFLRGVGRQSDNLAIDPGVATYIDGVYDAATYDASGDQLFIARTEVLRGPQGTLYGRNSIGGDINVISVMPTKDVLRRGSRHGGQLWPLPARGRRLRSDHRQPALPYRRQLPEADPGLLPERRHSRPDRGRQPDGRVLRGPAGRRDRREVRFLGEGLGVQLPRHLPHLERDLALRHAGVRAGHARAERRLRLQPGLHRRGRDLHPGRARPSSTRL